MFAAGVGVGGQIISECPGLEVLGLFGPVLWTSHFFGENGVFLIVINYLCMYLFLLRFLPPALPAPPSPPSSS